LARISEEILENIDIQDVIWRYVPLKKAGTNFSGLCPFHNEKSPSFIVSPRKQIFKCFGCGIGGDVITFIKEIERIDFWDAVKILAKDANIDLSKYERNHKKYAELNQWKEKMKREHTIAQNFFLAELQKSKEAQEYLYQKRKLDKDTIEKFGIWLAPDSHSWLLKILKEKWFSDSDMIEASLAKKSAQGENYSFFRKRIMFPIYDVTGNVVAFSGRVLDPKDKPKYLNSSEHSAFFKSKTLYGLHIAKKNIKEFPFLIVVEWQMDVVALYQLGFPVAVATSGTALTSDHIKIIKRFTDTVYFMFDNDSAGQEATLRALRVAYQQNLFPKLIDLPIQFKDVDELAKGKNAKEKFKQLLDSASDWFVWTYNKLHTSIDSTSPIDRQKMFNTMLGLILGLENPSTQIHYLHILAEKTGQSYEVTTAQYKQFAKNEWKFQLKQQQKQRQETTTTAYHPDRENIVASLFYQDFFQWLLEDKSSATKLMGFVQELVLLVPDTLFAQVQLPQVELTEEQSTAIKEGQLRREKEMQDHTDDDIRLWLVKKILWPHFQQLIQQLHKSPSVSAVQRNSLLQKMKEISR